MDRRVLACFGTSLLVVSGCGGGGGSAAPAPAPAAAPAPAPAVAPPAIDATALRLTQLNGACVTHNCVQLRYVSIDSNGEYTAVWSEQASGSNASLHAANADATGLLSHGVVDATYNNVSDSFTVVRSRALLYLNQPSPTAPGVPGAPPPPPPAPPPGGFPTSSKLVTFNTTGVAAVSAAVAAPALLQPATPIVRDLGGNLSAIVSTTTAPFPSATLAGNTSVALLTPAPSPYAFVDIHVFADFDSVAPRALWATVGKSTAGDVLGIYVDQVSLSDGAFVPIGKVSNQEVRKTGVTPRFCPAQPHLVSTANAEFAISWLQQNAAMNACDLVVNGVVVNAGGGWDVVEFVASGSVGNVAAAVWREVQPAGLGSRLRFSQRGPSLIATWSTPAPIDTTYDGSALHTVLGIARGPQGTMAVVWEPCEGASASCTTSIRLVSKFVAGAWTTQSVSRSGTVAAVAIDGSGRGVVLAVGESCSGSACTELSAYRF